MSEAPVYTLKQLAELLQVEVQGNIETPISGVEDISQAEAWHITFLDNEKYSSFLKNTKAGAIILSKPQASQHIDLKKNFLITNESPSLTFQKCIELFIKPATSGFSGVHPTAVIHPTVCIEENVTIEPYVVISQYARIGFGTYIGAGSFIGAYSTIGSNCQIHPKVVIRERVVLGNRVILQPGAVLGSCGFGYITNAFGHHKPLKHLGYVIIGDDVEIGANTTIDRGRFKNTIIHEGTKIDNQVQIAHHVEVGKHSIIVAQAGIAGSTKIGDHVIIGGQTGITGHISIADHVIMIAQTGVTKSITSPGIYGGAPARPYQETHRLIAKIRNLPKTEERLSKLERQVKDLLALNGLATSSET
ncbi:UDP-3-O-acylglucosamine N-acyltransferase,UDP-3-O-[3-hydroxymyristoyl] glucosamine N-acyltransferase,Acetyltransferase (isoleucine patch superfamily),UDP-3-O-[3-hydroxymyristoyl] glucosamine N-acyltransferase,Bacterial transferase hexapeptide (six repeats) [Chlamydia serpentis]|uniref:UDP-3-O-acylglucosamine N-acyltransferase n=1 Tax=Chlamydia serpentis TaxID=1967782 RepID=A0A2R8FAW3_9CHLA|nr:UDP-3-O-(3-hydroxymyristoyl)glucosamine N-acyltransferase [Chlamydia serpentis]SPN73446.1 UDP-3-O-acylglucosamine N-acyltransferase,UDP-3-O-[3-hydroxymyristoyl] glucosamine N-acyltransferase,Acetyltransferase (isoleucine patch superfamily),UDP-3-O-[3-hydroxymyristoyl] glucosamine N-acyltransferase,Bacterial transferase hexapeptide (six repeats) [Chlamydia serpentis]